MTPDRGVGLPGRRAVGRAFVSLVLAFTAGWCGAQGSAPVHAGAAATYRALLDDPNHALAVGLRGLADHQKAGQVVDEFWQRLALAEVHAVLGQADPARAQLQAAARLVDRGSLSADEALALEALRIDESPRAQSTSLVRRSAIKALRDAGTQHAAPQALCVLDKVERDRLVRDRVYDQALLAAERLLLCAQRQENLLDQGDALATLGWVAANLRDGAGVAQHFEGARLLLEGHAARYARARLLTERGLAHHLMGNMAPAEAAYAQARELNLALGLVPQAEEVRIRLAQLSLQQGQWSDALQMLGQSSPGPGLAPVAGHEARSLAVELSARIGLGEVNLRPLVARAMALDRRQLPGGVERELTRAVARAQSILGEHASAYAEMARALDETLRSQRDERDSASLALQMRYDAVQREAENRRLRAMVQADSERAAGQGAPSRQLLMGVLAVVVALLCAAAWVLRQAWHRWRWGRALRGRDGLTQLLDRAAVLALAQLQSRLACRLGHRLCVSFAALTEFDELRVRHGQAVADHAMQTLARMARETLRDDDGIGRWAPGTLLVVAPGIQVQDMSALLDRIRSGFARASIEGLPQPHGLAVATGASLLGLSRRPDVAATLAQAQRELLRQAATFGPGLNSAADARALWV